MHHHFRDLTLKRFKQAFTRDFRPHFKQSMRLGLLLTVGLTLFGCLVYRPEEPRNNEAITVSTAERLKRVIAAKTQSEEQALTPPVLKSSDLKNVEQMLLQRDRATATQKNLALEFVEDGQRLAAEATATGLHNERSGLSKLFCDSAIEYPTVDGLMGCAEALVLAEVELDIRVKQFGKAANIYRAIPAFARAIDEPLSTPVTQTIEANIACLERFIWSLDAEVADCQLITKALE